MPSRIQQEQSLFATFKKARIRPMHFFLRTAWQIEKECWKNFILLKIDTNLVSPVSL